jgi:cytochrome c-type biogenesis protein CcsB
MKRCFSRLVLIAFAMLVVAGRANGSASGIEDPKFLPVQDGGRVKPFDTYARELLFSLSGKVSWEGHPATSVAFSMMADGDAWKQKPIIKVEHLPLKEKFELGGERKYFSFQELLDQRDLVMYAEDLRKSGREDFDDLEKAALETYQRMVALDTVTRRMSPQVVPSINTPDGVWMSIGELEAMRGTAPFVTSLLSQWEDVQARSLSEDAPETRAALATWSSTIADQAGYRMVDLRKIDLEIFYNEMNPFRKAWVLYVAAFVVYLAGWVLGNAKIGFAANFFLWAGFLFHSGGLLVRQYLAGRPPISNLYEALTFICWGIVFLSILFEMVQRRRIHGTIAAVLGSIGLVLAEIMPIERELNPLVAVLRSYWMQYHVTTILLSYSALTLAAGLAHFHLFTEWFAPRRRELARRTSQLLSTAMKIGVTLLATGIILGAWWASESWGRYWGWDPKETWSLITLVGYIAVLHCRFAGWLTPYGVSVANVACWGLVLFTFYGVNFFLVGLHSYAGEAAAVKLPPLLIVYLAFEALVVGVGIWYSKSGRLRMRQQEAREDLRGDLQPSPARSR